jgi:hypothetical protein
MNKEELLNSLLELDTEDPESSHIKADELLLEFINDEEISQTFHNIEKWYS